MKSLFAIVGATVMVSRAGAMAAELPTFEALGFPITQHQIVVLGAARVEEQSPTPTLTLAGMPASLVQIAVLTPRAKELAAVANPAKVEPTAP